MKIFRYFYFLLLLSLVAEARYSNETCNCYLLGTVSSVEGESICNEETLQCKCYPNIYGLNCDRCAVGHYDILSSEGCSNCLCSAFGSSGIECDDISGQCVCNEGYTGLRCTQCESLKYKHENKCIDCHCNKDGSKNLQCDDDGKCICRENVEGKNCDRCKRNTHNFPEGCIPCSSCYDLLQTEINVFEYNMTKSQNAIDDIEKKLPTILENHESFINKIKLLGNKIQELKPKYEEPFNEKYEEIFLEFEKNLDNFQKELQLAFENLQSYNTDDTAKLIQGIESSLENINLFLLPQGQEEYKSAVIRSETLENHNNTLTKMSKSAQLALKKIENAVIDLFNYSLEVTEQTKTVCNDAKKLEESEKNTAIDLSDLAIEINETADIVTNTQAYVAEYSNQTNKIYTESILLTQQANKITVPVFSKISVQSAATEYTSFIITDKLSQVGDTAKEFNEEMVSTQTYFENVQIKQSSTNELFTTVKIYESSAESAIQLTDDVFVNGNIELGQIKNFMMVQQSIEDLLKDVPRIQEKIDAVQEHSTQARLIFTELVDIINANDNLKLRTDGILKIIEGNQDVILSNINSITEIEEEESAISVELINYHEKIKIVNDNVDKVNKLEDETKGKIKEIEGYLLVVDSITLNEEELESVDQEITTLENMYRTIDELNEIKENLKKEVANIKEILESLPIDDKTLCEAPESEPKLGSK